MDPNLIEVLKGLPLPVLYLVAIVWLAKTLLRKLEDQQVQLVALINRYHDLSLDLVRQLTIISEELKKG